MFARIRLIDQVGYKVSYYNGLSGALESEKLYSFEKEAVEDAHYFADLVFKLIGHDANGNGIWEDHNA